MLISFLLLHENICCGYSLEAPRRGASDEYPQHMFSWRNKKNIVWIPPLIYSYDCLAARRCFGCLPSHRVSCKHWPDCMDVQAEMSLCWAGHACSHRKPKLIWYCLLHALTVLILILKVQILTLLLNTTCPVLANSVDPDQVASEEASWPGSALFVIKYVNFCHKLGSSNLIGWKLTSGRGILIYSARQGLKSVFLVDGL